MSLWGFFQATRAMYDRLGFTHEIGAKARTCLEWEGVFAGKPVAGVTIIARDDRGAITSVRLHHRPFDQVVAFAETISRHLDRSKAAARARPSPALRIAFSF